MLSYDRGPVLVLKETHSDCQSREDGRCYDTKAHGSNKMQTIVAAVMSFGCNTRTSVTYLREHVYVHYGQSVH